MKDIDHFRQAIRSFSAAENKTSTKRLDNIDITVSGCKFTFLNGALLSIVNVAGADSQYKEKKLLEDRRRMQELKDELEELKAREYDRQIGE